MRITYQPQGQSDEGGGFGLAPLKVEDSLGFVIRDKWLQLEPLSVSVLMGP